LILNCDFEYLKLSTSRSASGTSAPVCHGNNNIMAMDICVLKTSI